MPLVLFFLGALETMVASLVGRVLLSLALTYVTYKGADTGIQSLLDGIKGGFGSMPSEVVGFLGWLWLDRAISLVFSAYTAATVIKFSSSGAITKLVRKTP